MAHAVVERRPRHHGDGDRQHGGERHHQQTGAARERPARRASATSAPRPPARPSATHERQLQQQQMRQITRRHVRHRDQRALVEFLPRLFEKRVEI